MKATLNKIHLLGFKSIRDANIDLKQINVLIGANGAGKSNLLSFFRMLHRIVFTGFQEYVAKEGYSNSILHYGLKTTRKLECRLSFEGVGGPLEYYTRIEPVLPDTLAFHTERVVEGDPPIVLLDRSGLYSRESAISSRAGLDNGSALVLGMIVSQFSVFQFHDTSATADIRQPIGTENNRDLQPAGGNLAAFLLGLRRFKRPYYDRIVNTIRMIAPFFDDFLVEPPPINPDFTSLRWKERERDYEFGPHQLSDGTLRIMALITLLLQPEELLPSLIVLDEPELGLHPSAVSVLCDLVRHASHHTQIVLATQSMFLLDQFEPQDVIVVDRRDGASEFRRLSADELKDWREDYSLSELWEMNVLGGKPAR